MGNKHVLLLRSSTVAERYRGIRQYAQQHGWRLFIENNVAEPPIDWRGDGALVAAERTTQVAAFVRSMQRRKIPIVDLSEHLSDIPLPRVTVDNAKIGQLAAHHFVGQAYRHLAFFSYGWSTVHQTRCDSFVKNGEGADTAVWAWTKTADRRVNDSREFSNWLGDLLENAPKPIGVFCYNDSDAVHVVDTCRICGLRIPDDVAILGVDDESLICTSQTVPLSSIRHNFRRIGTEGSALLERIMSGERFCGTIRIPPDGITMRQSTEAFGSNNTDLVKAFAYIDGNLSRPIGVPDVARHIGISRQRLYELFTREIRRSVGSEILRRRLALVKRLLASDKTPIARIAAKSGFCNASYLISVFRKAEGITPAEYRRAKSLHTH